MRSAIASAQEICNRGIETYPGTLEKQEIASQVERAGAELGSAPFESSVVLSGNFVLDKWRFSGATPLGFPEQGNAHQERGGMLSSDIGKPTLQKR
jgi:putative transposase